MPFAERIHLDFMDGLFTSNKSIDLEQAWMPEGKLVDLHLMYMRPDLYLDQILHHRPQLVIVQAEAKGNFISLAKTLQRNGIRTGVALLQETEVETIRPALGIIDYVLIFSGNLGHFGGSADLSLLAKVEQVRALKPGIEVGWDGGISDENAKQLVDGGVDVLNVGGYIHRSDDPEQRYKTLSGLL